MKERKGPPHSRRVRAGEGTRQTNLSPLLHGEQTHHMKRLVPAIYQTSERRRKKMVHCSSLGNSCRPSTAEMPKASIIAGAPT